ncbi:hypothetical protein LUZ60_008647 [Juncus effusus]|nr:hypothetical protein LUZ60_008647 [Juncus effusus]
MWRFKQFIPKEPTGLENRTIDISNIKVHIKELIAEGGFSSVYLAQDLLNPSKQYALKHIMIQDRESYDLIMKEISVMKSLKGHPNVVNLIGHAILDLGRNREAMLLMEFCEKSLVSVLENRGTVGYFEEKKILLIFRDVCNAVFAMHCQSPPVAHRDLKAENVLLGADNSWKLCDFGSISTNHKIFEKPEEMGIEEDNIRKHTTPAYRAPEMWDFYRKEVISEKVDIWALGCLLYRICYLKSAFDGESKLQILNGNYKIPDLPKFNPNIINLIKDMLSSSPQDRPDITQVWFRVNDMLPTELQKDMPDSSPNSIQNDVPKKVHSTPPPRRSPPPPPVSKDQNTPKPITNNNNNTSNPVGAFWSTPHAKDSFFIEEKDKQPPTNTNRRESASSSLDFEITFSPNGSEYQSKPVKKPLVNSNEDFLLQKEVDRLREELKSVNLEKNEIRGKYEKLCAICASQRKEIEELKLKKSVGTVPVQMDPPVSSLKSNTPTREKVEGGLSLTPSPNSTWNAFNEEPIEPVRQPEPPVVVPVPKAQPRSVRTVRSSSGNRTLNPKPSTTTTTGTVPSSSDKWAFDQDGFKAFPIGTGNDNLFRTGNDKNNSFEKKKEEPYQPAGWTGF